jgi:hypothetical protein
MPAQYSRMEGNEPASQASKPHLPVLSIKFPIHLDHLLPPRQAFTDGNCIISAIHQSVVIGVVSHERDAEVLDYHEGEIP